MRNGGGKKEISAEIRGQQDINKLQRRQLKYPFVIDVASDRVYTAVNMRDRCYCSKTFVKKKKSMKCLFEFLVKCVKTNKYVSFPFRY